MHKLDKIKVYVKRELLLCDVRPVPLLMHISDQDEQADLLYWNKLREVLTTAIEVCCFDELDQAGQVIVIPHSLKEYRRRNRLPQVMQFSQTCLKHRKFVIAHNSGSQQIDPTYFSLQFKTNSTKGNDDEATVPNWLYDLGYHPNLPTLKQPLVGFSGNVEYPCRLNSVAKHIQLPTTWINYLACSSTIDNHLNLLSAKQVIARYVRQALLSQLKSFDRVQVNILSRTTSFFSISAEKRRAMQVEYRSNITSNIYSIVIRGDGQGFFQLYEIMSAGRIPIIIDTGVSLPILREYRWTDFSLIVPFNQLNTLEEKICEFHDSHSEEELRAKCQIARRAYEELLPHNFVPRRLLPMIVEKSGVYNNQ